MIEFLDEYIEMKGYKAKNHYLAIRRWVNDAVKEQKARQEKNNNEKSTNIFWEMLKEEEDAEKRNIIDAGFVESSIS